MSHNNEKTGILIVGHGSPRPQANEGFIGLVGRIGQRLGGVPVLPAFFSIAKPSIEDQVTVLAAQGITHIPMMPYFLYRGQHISKDIPTLLEACAAQFPNVKIEFLPTLENEPALEEIVVERLSPYAAVDAAQLSDGHAIERRSFEIIDNRLGGAGDADPRAKAVIRRVVHATADFSFARSLRMHPDAIDRAIEAIAQARPIICDVKMLQAGITKTRSEVICAIGEDAVIQLAKERSCTRAAAAMELLAGKLDGAIVAVGNAPTALWKLMELVKAGVKPPAVVVGTPVGFVGARESKLALIDSGLCYISNVSSRGGSPVAAAVINALALLAKETRCCHANG